VKKEMKRPQTRDLRVAIKRLGFDKSPEMNRNAESKVLKDWKLSFNEANLTNYTQFGQRSKGISTSASVAPSV